MKINMKISGYIYCAINMCMNGIVKIGATEICPIKRVKELGNYTGCPIPFILYL